MSELDDIRRTIEEAVAEARLQPVPPNEACTCEWIIRPLLESSGYAKHEIVSQGATTGAGYPDYTILPDTEWTWYLEAKTWDKSLENGADAVQAINYANAQGRRWVVLSNGRQWLLFDNHLSGLPAPQRLVAQCGLEDPGFVDFLVALSKPSVMENRLAQFVTASRVRSVLERQLVDRDSEVVRAITGALKKLGITGVQASDVTDYFESLSSASREVKEPIEAAPRASGDENTYSLEELFARREQLAYTKPFKLSFPDGSTMQVKHWAELAVKVVEWLGQRGRLPSLPFRGYETKSKWWFLAAEPVHANGKHYNPKRIDVSGTTLFVETGLSSQEQVSYLHALCTAAGEPPEGFRVAVSPPLPPE